jgi:ketosteroid isomerase-like protein
MRGVSIWTGDNAAVSRQSLERMEAAFAALRGGDVDGVLAYLHDDFQVRDHVSLEASPAVRGPEALVENVAYINDAFGDVSWDAVEMVDLEDRICVRVVLRAQGKHSELPVEEEVGHVYSVEGGKARSLDIFRSWDEALAAAGVEG